MSLAAALLALGGALVALVGSLGLLRMKTFYERVHPPTLGTTLGTALVLSGSALAFFAGEARLPIQEALIALFMAVTTPVTYTLLVRAALRRDRAQTAEPSE
jgi:multicomponent K+:H+ antiporter subunit G